MVVGSRQGTRAGPDRGLPAPLRRMNHLVGAGFRLYDTLSPCIKAHALSGWLVPSPAMRRLLLVHGPVIPPGTAIRLPATPGWAVMEGRKGGLASLLRLDSLDLEGPLPGHCVGASTFARLRDCCPGGHDSTLRRPMELSSMGRCLFYAAGQEKADGRRPQHRCPPPLGETGPIRTTSLPHAGPLRKPLRRA